MARIHCNNRFCEAKQKSWYPKTAIRRGSVPVGYGDKRHTVCRTKICDEAEKGYRNEF